MRKRLSVDLTPDEMKWFKVQAAKHEKTIKDFVLIAVKKYCKESSLRKQKSE